MRSHHDVVIIGAGPSGSTLAYELARRNVTVLVVDKAVFPRLKCCGGGVTVRAGKLVGEGLGAVTENSISSALLTFSGSKVFHGDYDRTVIYTVNRERFDHFLLQKAESAGADVLQGVTVTGLLLRDSGVEVITSNGNFQGQFAVGADGNRSIVARTVNLGNHDHVVGIETEIIVDEEDLARWRSCVMVDLGRNLTGYAWLFPKKDHLSVGIASPRMEARNLKLAYWEFLKSLELRRYTIATWSAGLIPMCIGKPKVVQGRVAILGDAAGLADPVTGEGIYNALLSAQLAAPAIQNAVLHNDSELHGYQEAVDKRIKPEIEAARFFSKRLSKVPRKLLNMINLDRRIWNAGCSLVLGETSYSAIKDRIRITWWPVFFSGT